MARIEIDQVDRVSLLHRLAQKEEIDTTTPQGITIKLRENVFVPTLETFQLIDIAVDLLRKHADITSIADIGTGSGVIAVTIKKLFQNKSLFAADISVDALQLAKDNAVRNNVENIRFILNKTGQWIIPALPRDIDFIISNPPYIGDVEFTDPRFGQVYPEAKYEPQEAIRTFDPYGISPYINILEQSRNMQTRFYLFQCNTDYIQQLFDAIDTSEFYRDIMKDKFQKDRFLLLQRR